MIVTVWCPNCDTMWDLELEESDDDMYTEGQALICPNCTKNDSSHHNGGIIVKNSNSLDIFPGDS